MTSGGAVERRVLGRNEFVARRSKLMKKSHVDVIDQWNDGEIVATFTTPAEAYEAIRKLGQEARDGRWRYTLAPASRPLRDRADAAATPPVRR